MSLSPTEAPTTPQPRQLSLFTLFVTGLEAVGAVWAFSSLRHYWIVAESGPWPAQFWAMLALFFFCGGLVCANVVGVWLTLRSSKPKPHILSVRLPTYDGPNQEVAWGLLPLGLAFLTPAWPLVMVAWYNLFDLNPIWPGAALACFLVGVIILVMVSRQVYLAFVGGQTIVEIGAEPVWPGQEVALYVEHAPGRVKTQSAEVQLVCEQTIRETRTIHKTGEGRSSQTHNYKKSLIHQASLEHFSAAEQVTLPWQQQLTITLPLDALPTSQPEAYPAIEWMIACKLKLVSAPDIRMTFPFRVVVEEYEASDADETL
ncbi:MAG: hypothetical protein U0401_03310 [Anaerolineae bacterium]